MIEWLSTLKSKIQKKVFYSPSAFHNTLYLDYKMKYVTEYKVLVVLLYRNEIIVINSPITLANVIIITRKGILLHITHSLPKKRV